ncbi:hypothetical protein SMD20_05855 [Nonomuraea sp. LP-02]|uniref:hypothetical protein n=1 Tax=Nonomuraea sp. LP-02 TaxID=3097960 RepID=UPI002E307691|nr:hypothetical protein [Nonomuraea sp. LP-02]MED7923743.1 hypothetical protein [Nonomuraea sp. LP-02]
MDSVRGPVRRVGAWIPCGGEDSPPHGFLFPVKYRELASFAGLTCMDFSADSRFHFPVIAIP